MCVADVFCRIKYKVYKLTIKIKVYRGYKLYLYERYAQDTRAGDRLEDVTWGVTQFTRTLPARYTEETK